MKITIKGVAGLNGEYELDEDKLTNRDFHIIKKVAGLRGTEIREAIEVHDNDLLVAFAVCALWKAGHHSQGIADRLLDAPAGASIDVDAEEEEEEKPELPLVQTPPSPRSESGNGTSDSGGDSKSTGGHPESRPSHTGMLL